MHAVHIVVACSQSSCCAQDAVTVLPGWGTWANQQKEPHWMKAANQKAERYFSMCMLL